MISLEKRDKIEKIVQLICDDTKPIDSSDSAFRDWLDVCNTVRYALLDKELEIERMKNAGS